MNSSLTAEPEPIRSRMGSLGKHQKLLFVSGEVVYDV